MYDVANSTPFRYISALEKKDTGLVVVCSNFSPRDRVLELHLVMVVFYNVNLLTRVKEERRKRTWFILDAKDNTVMIFIPWNAWDKVVKQDFSYILSSNSCQAFTILVQQLRAKRSYISGITKIFDFSSPKSVNQLIVYLIIPESQESLGESFPIPTTSRFYLGCY